MDENVVNDDTSKMERDNLMYRGSPPASPNHRLDSDEEIHAPTKRRAFKNLKQESQEPLDFDDLLPHVGEFGKYQKLLVFLVCLPACIPCGMHAFSQLFMAPVPEHWCKVGGSELRTAAASIIRNQQGIRDETWKETDYDVAESPRGERGRPPVDVTTISHLEGLPSETTPPHFIGSALKKSPMNALLEDSTIEINSNVLRERKPVSLHDSSINGFETSPPNLTDPTPAPSKGRHHHQPQLRSKMHQKSFTIPASLTRMVSGSKMNKRNTPSGSKYPLRGSRNYNHKRAPYFNKYFDDTLLRDRAERSVSSDEEKHGVNIVKRGKYSLVEEDGHESHIHHPHDKQLLNIFATIAAIEERFERSLLSVNDEMLNGIGKTELPESTKDVSSTASTVPESEKSQELNNDGNSLMSEPHSSVEYNIPILTPKLRTDSLRSNKFHETRHGKFAFLPIELAQKDFTNRKDNSQLIKSKPESAENDRPSLAESSFAGNFGFSKAAAESRRELETENKSRSEGIGTEQNESRADAVYSTQDISSFAETVDEKTRANETESQSEDFDLQVEKFIRDIYIPEEATGKRSCCARYDVPPEMDLQDLVVLRSSNASTNWTQLDCDQGWVYDTSSVKSSIVIDFDLVCTRAIFPTIGLAVLNVGGIIGVYLFGAVSDKFGRRASFLLCLGTQQVSALMTAAAPSYAVWLACRFCVGLTIPAIYQIPFIISMELVGPNYRSFVTVLTCFSYVSGMMLLAGVAYLVRDWQLLCVVTSLPFFAYVVYWWFLPESPRWLLGRGRLHEASTILRSMARVNGAELPESFQQSLASQMLAQQATSRNSNKEKALDPAAEEGFCALWLTPNMRLKTLLIILVWFANETVYVGLSYYGPVMGENEYLAFFLSCLVEVPSYCVCWVVMDRWGRRWILGVGMILGGLCSVVTVLTPPESTMVAQSFYLVAKFAEAAAFLIIYPFSAELFPTSVRGVGIGFAAYVGGIGLIVIPFINYLGSEMLSLPLVIMGVLSVVGGIAAFRLPETLHQPLPNTIKEGGQFGKNFSWGNCWSCKPKDISSESDEDSGRDHESKKYRDEIIDLTTLNRLSIDDGRPLRRQKDTSLLADESDYVTENEYSVDEDDSSDDSLAEERVQFKRRKRRAARPQSQHSFQGTPFLDDERRHNPRSELFFSAIADASRNEDLSALGEDFGEPARRSGIGAEAHDPNTSTEGSRPGTEGSPKLKRGSTKRGKLVKQASIVPIITDSSGAMKMTFWM